MKNTLVKMFYGSSPAIFERAKTLRENSTHAEKILWSRLNNNQRKGFHFRRQHPLSRFVADFYAHKAKLVIEVDGDIHLKKEIREYDEQRTYVIESFGITIIRFRNEEIENNLEAVINKIDQYLESIEKGKIDKG